MNEQVLKKLKIFFSSYKIHEYNKGEILINTFDNPKEIYFLLEGLVKMTSVSRSGNEILLNIFKPNSFFPMSIVINESKNEYVYTTMSKAKIISAPREEIIKLVKDNPDILFDLLQRVYRGVDGLLLKLTYAMSSDAKSRIIIELLIEARRFGKKGKKYILNISISELATTVGLTRETVSRVVNSLKKGGLVDIKNKKIYIYDLTKLEGELT